MALLSPITANFLPHADLVSDSAIEQGHINRTYMTVVREGAATRRYIHQHINTRVFPQPIELMGNIRLVLDHLQTKAAAGTFLKLIPSDDGRDFYMDEDGQYWRCYEYVEGSTSFDVVPNSEIAYQAAVAFGKFLEQLRDLDPARLHVTIPDFHNTQFRMEQLDAARHSSQYPERVSAAQAELEFVDAVRDMSGMLVDLMARHPEVVRVTHNDTKVNNVLFCAESLTALAVIDLDTVMPGTALFDIGDLIRTACTTAEEDETDLNKVRFDFDRFEAIIRGFSETIGQSLHAAEWEAMPYCGAIITFTVGVRFLADYLTGDTYFRVHREDHNLDRARTQFELVRQQIEQINKLSKFVESERARLG